MTVENLNGNFETSEVCMDEAGEHREDVFGERLDLEWHSLDINFIEMLIDKLVQIKSEPKY